MLSKVSLNLNQMKMQKLTMLFCGCMLFLLGCNQTETTSSPGGFSFTVTPASQFTNLPPLQSFVFAQTDSCWLLFGGRTNGFHGFAEPDTDFPFKKANKFIYVYNSYTSKLDSMSVAYLPELLREQYTSSNMEHTQIGNYVYVAGGYGEINMGKPDSTWITHKTLSRVNVSNMIAAVQSNDSAGLKKSVVYDSNPFVASTGGEMFKLPDNKFYLAVGHRFTGPYSSSNAIQVYLDSVHVFTLTENDTMIKVNSGSFQYISDNLPDSVTQFRRRDLLVTPSVINGGKDIGLTIYGGVFTAASGVPFRNPIYLSGGATPSYQLDTSYIQSSNIYSTANFVMYDAKNDRLYTTAFGGIGDTTTPTDANFTKLIMTINRDFKANKTSSIFNSSALADYVGAESVFIPAKGMPMFNKAYSIIDFNALKAGKQLIGHIYGGIISKGPKWNPASNPTKASNVVYEVYMTKN
jgi:hypothetical protein